MPIFKNSEGKLKKLKTLAISKEKELQTLVEANLLETLEMHFLASEYPTTFGGRIDTLAVDSNGAPVIIEYKRNKNDNVINQGLSYLKWLKAQKVEFFEMLMMKVLDPKIRESLAVDWKNPRVICIAESYSKFDIDTVEVIPMRIELLKYRYYEEGIFSLEPLAVSDQQQKTVQTSPVTKVPNDASPETLLAKSTEKVKDIFYELQEKILSLDENITEKTTSLYIAYRVTKNFVEIHPLKESLKVYLRPVDYDDPASVVETISEGYNWTMNRRVYLKDKEKIEYTFNIIEQSYKDVL